MRKKTFLVFLYLIMASFMLSGTAFADPGEGNIDSGGGDLGKGSSSNIWHGHEGVRVTVIRDSDNAPVSTPIDYTSTVPPSNMLSFSKVSKIGYRAGAALIPSINNYSYLIPDIAMPRIISSSNIKANIEEIKKYFCSEYAAKMIAEDAGMRYEDLISGDYKLLLEPIAYVTFNDIKVGMTATEAALYDMQLNGDMHAKMPSLSHKNLPLSMFLEISDLGYPAWDGPTDARVSNDQILSALGLGIVRYREQLPDPVVESADYEYRTDTEVITPISLSTTSRLTPDNPASVTFYIMGSSYTVSDIVIPAGDSQVVWCKWRTPSTPQTVIINITCNSGSVSNTTIRAKIADLNQNPPPNPTAKDRNSGYSLPSIPSNPQQLSASWSVWRCNWVSKWEKCWHSDWVPDGIGGGYWDDWYHWVDNGDWAYTGDNYWATLSASGRTNPDARAITSISKNMKSGYGVNISVNTSVSTNAPANHTTWAQNAISYFPEFSYNTYWRLHDRIISGYNATLELKQNKYSTYNRRVHFTPVWFPNGAYTTYTQVIDAWTPAGMLSMNLTDYVNINKSVFDDWRVAPK